MPEYRLIPPPQYPEGKRPQGRPRSLPHIEGIGYCHCRACRLKRIAKKRREQKAKQKQ